MDDTSDQLFKEGKKLYVVGDYGKALEFLSKACKLREKELGHLHENMFESYYYLAKGYYMFSKYDNELIGDGLEIDKEKEIQDSNMYNTQEAIIDSGKVVSDGEKKSESEQEVSDPKPSDSVIHGDDSDEYEEKENLTYLQLAYETIECAKLVLKNQINEKVGNESNLEIKLADCCDLEGNIYMEEDVISEAIEEYSRALELRKKNLNLFDRSIAESHYNLGVAFSAGMRLSEAVGAYQQCREILVKCQSFEGGSKAAELAEVIADLDEKIHDAEDGERDYALAKESIKQFMMAASSDQPVTDLTHLLRRKADVPRSDGAAEEPPVSKRKLE